MVSVVDVVAWPLVSMASVPLLLRILKTGTSSGVGDPYCGDECFDGASLVDEIVRECARRMLAAALEAEVAAYIAAHAGELHERGQWH
jgi:hypothetical protein